MKIPTWAMPVVLLALALVLVLAIGESDRDRARRMTQTLAPNDAVLVDGWNAGGVVETGVDVGVETQFDTGVVKVRVGNGNVIDVAPERLSKPN